MGSYRVLFNLFSTILFVHGQDAILGIPEIPVKAERLSTAMELLNMDKDSSVFAKLLDDTGASAYLEQSRDITMVVPTNEAFIEFINKIDEKELKKNIKDLKNGNKNSNVIDFSKIENLPWTTKWKLIQYHIIPNERVILSEIPLNNNNKKKEDQNSENKHDLHNENNQEKKNPSIKVETWEGKKLKFSRNEQKKEINKKQSNNNKKRQSNNNKQSNIRKRNDSLFSFSVNNANILGFMPYFSEFYNGIYYQIDQVLIPDGLILDTTNNNNSDKLLKNININKNNIDEFKITSLSVPNNSTIVDTPDFVIENYILHTDNAETRKQRREKKNNNYNNYNNYNNNSDSPDSPIKGLSVGTMTSIMRQNKNEKSNIIDNNKNSSIDNAIIDQVKKTSQKSNNNEKNIENKINIDEKKHSKNTKTGIITTSVRYPKYTNKPESLDWLNADYDWKTENNNPIISKLNVEKNPKELSLLTTDSINNKIYNNIYNSGRNQDTTISTLGVRNQNDEHTNDKHHNIHQQVSPIHILGNSPGLLPSRSFNIYANTPITHNSPFAILASTYKQNII